MKPEDCPRLPGWANSSEISDTLGISRQTANQMIHAGDFKTLHHLPAGKERLQFFVKITELEKMKETRIFPRSKNHSA